MIIKQWRNHLYESVGQLRSPFVVICLLLGTLSTALGYQLGEIDWYYFDRSFGGGPHYPIHMQLLDQFSRIQLDIQTYQEKHGNPPAQLNLSDLLVYTESHETHDFDPHEQPLDPWKRPFIYQVDGSQVKIGSLGRDGIKGGQGLDADLSSSSGRMMTRFELPPISLVEFLRNRKLFRKTDEISMEDPRSFGLGCAILTFFCLIRSFRIRHFKKNESQGFTYGWIGWRMLCTPVVCAAVFPFLIIFLFVSFFLLYFFLSILYYVLLVLTGQPLPEGEYK